MSGLNFTLGGKLDPSFKASLNQAAAEAQAAGLRIQSSLRTQIGGIDKKLSGMDPMQPGAAILMDKRASLSRALLIAQNGQFLSAAKGRIAMREAEAVAAKAAEAKLAESAVKATGHIAGLNLVIRESIVLLREWGRGNYARMPGSASLVAQGLAQMGATGRAIAFLNKPLFNNAAASAEGAAAGQAAAKGMIGALASIPLVAMAIVAGSLAAIIGAPFIYFHRVKRLAAELGTNLVSTFNPEHIARYLSKLEILNELQKDVADSARQIQEAHDSAGDAIQRELDLTKDRLSFERELLEIQKSNELAAAKNPAEREAIEKKYSTKILAKKKEERDAELNALKEKARQLPAELLATRYQIAKLTNGDYVTDARDKQILEKRKDLKDQADAYFKQVSGGEKDSRTYSADKDRKIISDLMHKKEFGAAAGPLAFGPGDQAKLDAANNRMKDNAGAQQSYNTWLDTANDRERARARVKELETKVKDDAAQLAKLLGASGHGGVIADQAKLNLQKDQEDLALENERLKRVDAGKPLSGREVTERERVGFGSPQISLLDVNRSMDRKLGILVQHAQRSKESGGPGNFGDDFNW